MQEVLESSIVSKIPIVYSLASGKILKRGTFVDSYLFALKNTTVVYM